jgi:hypothetical protein
MLRGLYFLLLRDFRPYVIIFMNGVCCYNCCHCMMIGFLREFGAYVQYL